LGYSLAWGNRDINSGRIKIWKALHSSKRRWGHVLPRLSSSSSPTLAVRPSIRTSILRLFPAFHPCKRERTQLIQGDRRPIDVCVACASREKIYEGFSARQAAWEKLTDGVRAWLFRGGQRCGRLPIDPTAGGASTMVYSQLSVLTKLAGGLHFA
jgi:hypothetical protein